MRRGTGDRQLLLAYATDENAPEYRAIMDVFLDAAASYELPLRIDRIDATLRSADPPLELQRNILNNRLERLAEWGNLHPDEDNSYATSLDTYERRERVYDLSQGGEAAHDALVGLEDRLRRQVGLQRVALARVLELLTNLVTLLTERALDGAALYHVVEDLHHTFKSLTSNASAFVHQVNRMLNAVTIDVDEYQVFKVETIVYVTEFSDDLAAVSADIRRAFAQLDGIGPDRLVHGLRAAREISGERETNGLDRDSWADVAQRHVAGVREWFESNTGAVSGVDKLRRVLLRAVGGIGQALDRLGIAHMAPSAWTDDVLDLARAFQQTEDMTEVHRLWQLTTGLGSARHFTEDDPGQLYAPTRNWHQEPSPPQTIRLRSISASDQPRRTQHVADHRAEKHWLAVKALSDKKVNDEARTTLVGLGRVRLSEITQALEHSCLLLLVGLIQKAHHAKRDGAGVRKALSTDGRLRITLGPDRPPSAAALRTAGGQLIMPDFEVEIRWARGAITTGPEGTPAVAKDERSW